MHQLLLLKTNSTREKMYSFEKMKLKKKTFKGKARDFNSATVPIITLVLACSCLFLSILYNLKYIFKLRG